MEKNEQYKTEQFRTWFDSANPGYGPTGGMQGDGASPIQVELGEDLTPLPCGCKGHRELEIPDLKGLIEIIRKRIFRTIYVGPKIEIRYNGAVYCKQCQTLLGIQSK